MPKTKTEFAKMVAFMMKAQRDLYSYEQSPECIIDGSELKRLQETKKQAEEDVLEEIYSSLYPMDRFKEEIRQHDQSSNPNDSIL